MEAWIRLIIEIGSAVAAALLAGLLIRLVLRRGRLGETLEPDARATIAKSFSLLVLAVAAVLILSGRNEVIRQDLLLSTVSFLPRLVVGAMIIIIAFVLSKLGGVIVEQAIRPRSPALAVRARGVVAGAVVVIGLLLAMKQMGLETDVLMIVVAGVVATATLAGGLGIGLGSQPLARQIAAGRHVEDRFTIGQVVRVGDLAGRISSIDMASVTLVDEAGRAWVVPHLSFLDNAVETSPD